MDITHTTEPNSDQLNADNFLDGPRTITVTEVKVKDKSEKSKQPVAIFFNGDDGKPYLPCLSMRRVIHGVWGKESKDYSGRSMTLYCDPTVTHKGKIVGGIRISHMSHITESKTLNLTIRQSQKAPWTIQPLKMPDQQQPDQIRAPMTGDALIVRAKSTAEGGTEMYRDWFQSLTRDQQVDLTNTKEHDPDDFNLENTIHDICKGIAARAGDGKE